MTGATLRKGWTQIPLLIALSLITAGSAVVGFDNCNENWQYIELLSNRSGSISCWCAEQGQSDYTFSCNLHNQSRSQVPAGSVPCAEMPFRIAASLTIDCSVCYECARVNLHSLTTAKFSHILNTTIFPPQEVSVADCQINSYNIGTKQLEVEGVGIHETMEVAQFGVPQRPGVGGYYTVNVTYPTAFNGTDCLLTYLHMDAVDMWFLPVYLMHKCLRLRTVSIRNSQISSVSMNDLLALRDIDGLTLSGCNVRKFANDAPKVALDSLDDYLQTGSSQFEQNNRTLEAIERLRQMRKDSGRLNRVTYLYDMMDTANISFSLVFGYRAAQIGSQLRDSDIPRGVGLSYLDLSHNNLTEIPYSISMFGYLSTVNLSHNKITGLYRSWLCWYPPIPERDKTNSSRHCYWFRGSRETLKALDLSYNRIDQIGEIQPWHGVALSTLYLHHNMIVSINSDAFSHSLLSESLLGLHLDDNGMTEFLLKDLARLEKLSMRNCRIESISEGSLPQSVHLFDVRLANNKISTISAGAFSNLTSLDYIDLTYNKLTHQPATSFVMPARTTLGSRVVLSIGNQSRTPICDCNHVYAKILEEELTAVPHTAYYYPRLLWPDRNSLCRYFFLYPHTNGIMSLSNSTSEDYLCRFNGSERQKIPDKLCNGSQGEDACLVTCTRHCSCYHDNDWSISDLNCQGIPVDLVRIRFALPIKYMDLSGASSSQFLLHISRSTFKWTSDALSSELLVLFLHGSNVHFIENDAFHFNHSLMNVSLHDNAIKTLSSRALCSLKKLVHLTLHNNSLTLLEPDIFNGTCLPRLMDISLRDNPWRCSCEGQWMQLHSTLLAVSRTTQVVSDFDKMQCTVDQSIMHACQSNEQRSGGWQECSKVMTSIGNYSINDDGNLITLCSKIQDSAEEQRKLIAWSAVGGVFGVMLSALVCLAIRRRHRLLAVVRVLILLRYQRDRRIRQQVTRDSIRYDAMLWAADRDQDRLADVLNRVRSVSGAEELELCVPQSFLYSSLCSCPLTYFDCPAEGAKYSGKVVVALSERFLDTEYLALCQVIRELDSLGRSPFSDIIFLRLSRDVSLRRHQRRHRGVTETGGVGGGGDFSAAGEGSEDVQAFKTLQRILANSDIVYDSVDWEYRLVRRIRSGGSATVAATDEPQLRDSADQSSEPAMLRDLPSDEQPLVLDVESVYERTILRDDWPPFYSDQVAELFIISVTDTDSSGESSACAATKTIIDEVVTRMTGVRLGTSDRALLHSWPDSFEQPTVTAADQINSYMMKRTRQFVLLLSNRLLDWFKDEPELQCEFEAFLAGNTFRRRLLVILVGQVDTRSRHRYQALANQRLDGVESEQTPNWCDMTTVDGDAGRLGNWLDNVLYKRTA